MAHSLFYEYAITPDVFHGDYINSDVRLEIILSELLKGIRDNGMIANLNKDGWMKLLERDRLKTILPLIFKDKLIRYLNTLRDRNRLVRHPKATHENPSTDLEWLQIALESHGQIKFDGIIAPSHLLSICETSCSEFIDAVKVLDSPHWSSRRKTLTLSASEPYYRPVLDPVLRHARKLIIVDPFFSPHVAKFTDFLKICAEQMGRRGQSVRKGQIIIHAGNPEKPGVYSESVDKRLDEWEAKIKSMFTTSMPHKINIILRDQRPGGKRFHDRFILTDQCCIDIPLGTDVAHDETPDNTTWCLLDYEDMQQKAQEIQPEMKIYEKLGERLII
jgi:hypothetical protein